MKQAQTIDVLLLLLLGAIWGSSFFNIKIATHSYEPFTLALVRVVLATLTMLLVCYFYKIKIYAFSSKWKIYAVVSLCNIAIPFSLIAIGTNKVDSYLAAILMSTTPISGSILAHFFTKNEKITFLKSLGILLGFSGILLLFFDKIIINSNNIFFVLINYFAWLYLLFNSWNNHFEKFKRSGQYERNNINFNMVSNFFITDVFYI